MRLFKENFIFIILKHWGHVSSALTFLLELSVALANPGSSFTSLKTSNSSFPHLNLSSPIHFRQPLFRQNILRRAPSFLATFFLFESTVTAATEDTLSGTGRQSLVHPGLKQAVKV